MSFRYRPQLHALEAREVPASFSSGLSDGTTVSGSFSDPAGVDPAQSSQALELTDLSVVRGGVSYTVAPVPLAYYSYGVLTGVVANTFGPDDQIDLGIGTATVTPYWSSNSSTGSIAYDPADSQVTFTLPDGTTGSISYQIPWGSVDVTQSSQSLTPTAFNLNIAGQNIASGFATAPSLTFEYGEFTGVDFAFGAVGAYSSLSMTGFAVTAVLAANGQPILTNAAPERTFISADFGNAGGNAAAYNLTVFVVYSDSSSVEVTLNVAANTTSGGLRDAVYQVLKDNGVDVTLSGDNRLIVTGTKNAQFASLRFNAPNVPSINNLIVASRGSIDGLTPDLKVNGVTK